MDQLLRTGLFIIEKDEGYERGKAFGYTDGNEWNGWATPKFEKDVIDDYLRLLSYKFSFIDGNLVIPQGYKDEPDVFVPQSYNTVDGKKTLYYLEKWCWTEVPLPTKVILKELRGRIEIEGYSDCRKNEYGGLVALFSHENFIRLMESHQQYCETLGDGSVTVKPKTQYNSGKPVFFKPQSFYTDDGWQILYEYYPQQWQILKKSIAKSITHGYYYCLYHGSDGSKRSSTFGPFSKPLYIQNGDLYSLESSDPIITTNDQLRWYTSNEDNVDWAQLLMWYE